MRDPTVIDLNGEWTIRQCDGEIRVQGLAPGVVHHDLIRQGLVEDPFRRMNELDQQWVGDATWEYARAFTLTREQAARAAVVLNCDGLDTVCDVFVNDRPVASTDNMFLRYRWDIKPVVRAGANEVRIRFHPARAEMTRRYENRTEDLGPRHPPYPWFGRDRAFLRKAQCHSGWDWGACFLTPGIWRDVSVEARDGGRILYLTHQQTHRSGGVDVELRAVVDAPACMAAELDFKIGDVSARVPAALQPGENAIRHTISIGKPRLWWPNGLGEQALYETSATLTAAGETDVMRQRIGLRTMEVVTEDDEAGQSFLFRVNGVDVFAKGSNWIPGDSFDSRLTDDQIAWELSSAARAHQNMIRVWGGGIYERDRFYELCDELGLMVWQDFMFACAMYPGDPWFLDSVALETRHQVRRLMHHPSLALWCGNNEIQEAVGTIRHFMLYDDLFVKTILPIVRDEDPARRYWPASPSGGLRVYDRKNDENRGDTHYWNVWHGDRPFTDFLTARPRFASEFGFQSFASPDTMETVTDPGDRNIASEVFEFHQRCHGGNTKMLSHLSRWFRVPNGYEEMLYVSQALQAVSIQTACEHWRRIKPHCMGTLIWQLNDIWPVASWSSLEFDGRWKMLHYFARRFFAPLLVSSPAGDGAVEIWATSDVNAPLTGTLTCELLDVSGRELLRRTHAVSLAPMQSRRAAAYDLAELCPDPASARNRVLRLHLSCGAHQSETIRFFAPFKHLCLCPPELKTELREERGAVTLTLESRTLAPFTWIRHGKVAGTWSDNGIHLLPGQPVSLTFTPRRSCALDDLKRALMVHTLFEAGYEAR